MDKIVDIAQRSSNKWLELTYLTKKFESHDIDHISSSRCGEDERRKDLRMLTKYNDRGGTRQKLPNALKKLGMLTLCENVFSGCFIRDDQ